MPNAHEMSDFALVVARDAVDRMIDYVASDLPTYEEIVEASMVLIDSRQATEHDHRTRGAWEHHAANMVLDAARTATYPSEPEANGVDSHDGYRLIAERNYADALGLADSLLLAAAGTDQDDWNYGNLVHHAHIIRGKVHLALGDIPASADELTAAGDIDGSPQLNSFGPDLSLAWELLRVGREDAVIVYFRKIARFWTPSDPIGDQPDPPIE